MPNASVDISAIRELVRRRLLQVPESAQKRFPFNILETETELFTFMTDNHFILAFVNPTEKKRIKEMVSKGYYPFPGLIKPANVDKPVFFKVEKTQNSMIGGLTFEGAYILSLGKDCTLVLFGLKHSINLERVEQPYEYTVKLAYVVSFGDEINADNFQDYLENLIAYSFEQWRRPDKGA